MADIAKNILDRVGGTPLVEISPKLNKGAARVLAKGKTLVLVVGDANCWTGAGDGKWATGANWLSRKLTDTSLW